MFVGMDLHKKSTEFIELDEKGNKIREDRFLNTTEELDSFIESLDEDTKVVMEASGVWNFVYERLEDAGVDVKLAHPKQVKAIANAKVKTDKIDARVLAHLLRLDYIPEAHVPPRDIRDLRTLVRHRVSLVRLRTQVKNKIHALLAQEGIRHPFTDLFGKGGRIFLRSVELKKHRQRALENYLSVLDNLGQLITGTDESMEEIGDDRFEVELLKTIPGVGTYTALVMLAEIGDVKRFNSPKQLFSYAGVVPRVYSSGETVRHGHIIKDSNGLLRWVAVQTAHRAVRSENKYRRFYLKLKSRKGSKVAIVATARKILESVYWVLIRKEPADIHGRHSKPWFVHGLEATDKMMRAA